MHSPCTAALASGRLACSLFPTLSSLLHSFTRQPHLATQLYYHGVRAPVPAVLLCYNELTPPPRLVTALLSADLVFNPSLASKMAAAAQAQASGASPYGGQQSYGAPPQGQYGAPQGQAAAQGAFPGQAPSSTGYGAPQGQQGVLYCISSLVGSGTAFRDGAVDSRSTCRALLGSSMGSKRLHRSAPSHCTYLCSLQGCSLVPSADSDNGIRMTSRSRS